MDLFKEIETGLKEAIEFEKGNLEADVVTKTSEENTQESQRGSE